MGAIKRLTTNKLSFYRTSHVFQRYGEFSNVDEFLEYHKWAKENNANFYIVGNGSNTLFIRKKIKTLILRNNLEKYIKPLDKTRVEVSSSVFILDLLKYCYENSLDSFYYLASVPATVGGALAMNAGRGKEHNATIYDFVESITFIDNGKVRTLKADEIKRTYRETMFTGKNNFLIVSSIFKFSSKEFEENPISSRRAWSKEYQDYTAPNCGSVFKISHTKILGTLKGLRIQEAQFSSKTYNWILNNSDNSKPIVLLIRIAQFLHLLGFKKSALEIIEVD